MNVVQLIIICLLRLDRHVLSKPRQLIPDELIAFVAQSCTKNLQLLIAACKLPRHINLLVLIDLMDSAEAIHTNIDEFWFRFCIIDTGFSSSWYFCD